jgi:type VI protein secretion system component VasK
MLPLLRGVLTCIQLNFVTGGVLKVMRSVFGPRREVVQEDVENSIILRLLFTLLIIIVIIINFLLLRCQIKEGKGKVKEHTKGEKMSRSTRV